MVKLPDDNNIAFELTGQSIKYITLLHNSIWKSNFNVFIIDNIDLFLSYNMLKSLAHYIIMLLKMDLTLIFSFNNPMLLEFISEISDNNINKNLLIPEYIGKGKFIFNQLENN